MSKLHQKFGSFSFYLLLLLIVILTVSLFRNIIYVGKANSRINEAEQKLDELKIENAELQADLEKIKSRPYLEKQIRDKLNLVDKNEIVLVLPEDEILKQFSPRRPRQIEEFLPPPNWKAWLELFI